MSTEGGTYDEGTEVTITATWVTHECDSCDYSFVGSGKPDALMRGPTIPVVCLKCNEIYDRIIHSPIGEKLNGKCYECGSKKYTEWDYEAKKCPQCEDGVIDESDEGVLIMAD